MPNHPDEEDQHLATLDELEATREQIASYQGLLEALPQIYERKFNDRLKPYLARHQQLIDEREQMLISLQRGFPAAGVEHGEGKSLLLNPSPSPTPIEAEWPARPRDGHVFGLIALAALGLAIGVQLSPRNLSEPKQTSTPYPQRGPSRPAIRPGVSRVVHQSSNPPTARDSAPATPNPAMP